MNIRLATTSDLTAILTLERQSPSAAHWTEQQYRDLFESEMKGNSQRLLLVIEEDSMVISQSQSILLGFLIAHHVDREWELENIAVSPAARRHGLATLLVQELLRRARETQGESVFLEVRESNQLARALYEKLGFSQSGRRTAYYRSPHEDAILYRRLL